MSTTNQFMLDLPSTKTNEKGKKKTTTIVGKRAIVSERVAGCILTTLFAVATLADATRPDQSITQTVAPATTEKAAAPLQEPHVCLASPQTPLQCGCTYGAAICIVEACKLPHVGNVCGSWGCRRCRCVSLKVITIETPANESHDEKNARLCRPQSPHLTIYKMQLTSMLSITHRMTGLAMSFYLTTLGLGTLLSRHQFTCLITWLENSHLSPLLISAMKFTMAFPLAYHVSNGIRHLVWDLGKALTLKEVYYSGYAMLASSTILTVLLMLL